MMSVCLAQKKWFQVLPFANIQFPHPPITYVARYRVASPPTCPSKCSKLPSCQLREGRRWSLEPAARLQEERPAAKGQAREIDSKWQRREQIAGVRGPCLVEVPQWVGSRRNPSNASGKSLSMMMMSGYYNPLEHEIESSIHHQRWMKGGGGYPMFTNRREGCTKEENGGEWKPMRTWSPFPGRLLRESPSA